MINDRSVIAIISTRGIYINMPCLLGGMLKLEFWKGKLLNIHTDSFI